MIQVAHSSIRRIEIFSHWAGFADPPSRTAKLTITNRGGRFFRQQAMEATNDELPERVIAVLLEALAQPAIPRLDPTLFDAWAAAIDRHYNSCWTDDYPSHLFRIECDAGRQIAIKSDAQQAFMLPLKITDSAADAAYETFDPQLSRALADLMPEGYLDRDRLAGHLGLLELDREEIEREGSARAPPAHTPAAFVEPDDETSGPTTGTDDIEAEMFRILFGKESAQEVQAAEQSGRLSERLLKRNSLATVQDLLARGADPSVADDVGQTALMHAAFPPFNRERFRLLVDAGADLEARRRDGMTGLHLACAGGEADAASEWVKAGADITARAPGGATPLMLAATWPEIVQTLLENGADVNVVDDDGHSALVYSILRQSSIDTQRQMNALQALLDAGADVNQRDHAGVSPLGHARKALAAVRLEEEVIQAQDGSAGTVLDGEWTPRKMAESVVALLAAHGAHE